MRLLIFLMMCCAVFGATTTWDGSTDTDWGTAANWDTNAVPTTADAVIIPTGFTGATAVVIGDVAINALSIVNQGTGTITLDTNAVTCVITCATLGNSQTNTADLLTIAGVGTATIVGNIEGPDASSDSSVITASACTIIVNGNITGGDASSCYGLEVSAAATTVTVSGIVAGGDAWGLYLSNTSIATVGTVHYENAKAVPIYASAYGTISISTLMVNGVVQGGTGGGGYRSRYNFN